MTLSVRDAGRSHGLFQHGGGSAAERLVPLSAGEQTHGAGRAELRGLDAQLPRHPSLQSLISGDFSYGFYAGLGLDHWVSRGLGREHVGRPEGGNRAPTPSLATSNSELLRELVTSHLWI